MYKLRTKDGTYIFTSLVDLFNFIDEYENNLFECDSDYVKIYFLNMKGIEEK